MRISGRVRCGGVWPLREALPELREVGYDAVELNWRQARQSFATARDPVAALSVLLDEHGLTLSGLDIANATATDASGLAEMMRVIRPQMSFARALGVEAVHLRGGDRRGQSLEMLVTALDVVLGEAEEMNLDVCLANARGSRVEQLEDLRRVFHEIRHPQLRLMNDTGQFQRSAVNPRDALAEFGDRTSVLRLTDRRGGRCVPLGEGEMNVPAIIEHARRIGFTGWLVLDGDLPDAGHTRDWLAEGLREVRRLLAG